MGAVVIIFLDSSLQETRLRHIATKATAYKILLFIKRDFLKGDLGLLRFKHKIETYQDKGDA
jgi:hypothetical protein